MSGTITTTRGVNKIVAIGRQSSFGTIAATNAGALLRRINSTIDLSKDIFQSPEINPSQVVRFSQHGTRRVNGSVSGELAPGAYATLFENLLRRTFSAGVTYTATTITAGTATLTRGAGSWLTDGYKIGDVVRCTGWTAPATGNNNVNLQVIGLTSTVMTFRGTGQEVLTAKASGDSVTVSVVGKKTFVPNSGAADLYETIEHLYDDLSPKISERFVGLKVTGARLNLPASGLCTVDFQLIGRDKQTGSAAYFTAPTALNSQPTCRAVNGKVRLNGSDIASVTSMQLSISTGVEAGPVMGQNLLPQIALGTLSVGGSMTAYMEGTNTMYDLFDQETEVELLVLLESNGTANAPFISLTLPRVKLNSASKNDNDRSIMQSINFEALQNLTGGSGIASEQTVITLQDSAA